MARTNEPHSATSQFFINTAHNDFLNHTGKTARGWGYTVFGKVTKGMDVVEALNKTKTGSRSPFPSDVPLQALRSEAGSGTQSPPPSLPRPTR